MFIQTQIAQSVYAISPRSHHTHIDLCSHVHPNTSRSECICDLTAHPPHSYRSVPTCSTTTVARCEYAISPRSHHTHIDLCSHVCPNSRSECICDLTAHPPHSYRSMLTCSTTNVARCKCDLTTLPPHSYRSLPTCSSTNVAQTQVAQSVYAISPLCHHTHIDLCPHVRPQTSPKHKSLRVYMRSDRVPTTLI